MEEQMVTLERMIQHVYPDKWPELAALDAEYNQIESRFGFPAKKRYLLIAGPDEVNTLVIEREWPSLAAMEAAFEKVMADPGWQAVNAKGLTIIKDQRWELYSVLP
jgi:hypothetical protein